MSKLKQGEKGNIVAIHADKILRSRFNSLGIATGEEVTIKECSLAKQTIEIAIGTSLVVLRKNEAVKIEIKRHEEDEK